ncbi:hypothetical protein ABZP36_005780 [Zizania latifolia]
MATAPAAAAIVSSFVSPSSFSVKASKPDRIRPVSRVDVSVPCVSSPPVPCRCSATLCHVVVWFIELLFFELLTNDQTSLIFKLRAAIAATYYADLGIEETDIFVSDGAKCDISRLQVLFGSNVKIAVQDPSYPAYVDSSVIMGQTGLYQEDVQKYGHIEYMRCNPENGFFPDLSSVLRTDVIFFCSPNNPTDNGSIIVYDSAYAMYISDDSPKSIFEIPGAKERLSPNMLDSLVCVWVGLWSLRSSFFSDGHPVAKDFNRIVCTCFNGASNISQAGGLGCLSPEGLKAMSDLVGFYKENTKIIVDTFTSLGFNIYGAKNAPYVWVHFPGRNSWDVFAEILENAHVVTTPGTGFGPGGEGFVRVSVFGHRENIIEAARRLKQLYK